ncbi:zinc finger and SCAN domain-containing protein 23 [Hippocampus zosterae]|uniref:zinc finger and SCAN domain-containing protein 23 n=1 Tax=Hippocampus zosterae TaxID=109293 RepID=UPI00223CDB56|nr:zinc finger and SCAN domain-containing protein 23 [Hippocampus zosterae]
MDEEQAESYESIKAAVLLNYNVTEETYRHRFRSTIVPMGETVRESYNRLKGLYRRWMRPDHRSKDQIGEVVILEHYLRVLQPEVRIWVKEHNPKTGEEAAELAERYMAAHREPYRKKGPTVKFKHKGHRPIHPADLGNADIGARRQFVKLQPKGDYLFQLSTTWP